MPIQLTCEESDIFMTATAETLSTRIIAAYTWFWSGGESPNECRETKGDDCSQFVVERTIELAILRELQIVRAADIVSFRERCGFSKEINSKFSGIIGAYHKQGIVRGVDGGIDKSNGYPYKRWIVADGDKAVSWAKQRHWPLMTTGGKIAIESRCEVSNG